MALSTHSDSPISLTVDRVRFPWLYRRNWDVAFISLSVLAAIVPYSTFLFFGGDDGARQVVNGLVTFLVGGPHMYATFNRTFMDPDFRRRRKLFVMSSALVPIAVIALIVTQYVAMLTLFFFLASLHALQQVAFLTDCYVKKSGQRVAWWSRGIDYLLIFSALYPWAATRMMKGDFKIGPVMLWSPLNPGQFLYGQWWVIYALFAVFLLTLLGFIVKSAREWQQGRLNVPKTLLIVLTVPLLHFTPLIENLDTAFQGINVWHSFQYLAITWYAMRLFEARTGHMNHSLLEQFHTSVAALANWLRSKLTRGAQATPASAAQSTAVWTAAFYTFQLGMLPISGLLFAFARVAFPNLPYAEQYGYLMVLPVLLVHYYHDAFLFRQPESLVDE
jgi:hypothetical protein